MKDAYHCRGVSHIHDLKNKNFIKYLYLLINSSIWVLFRFLIAWALNIITFFEPTFDFEISFEKTLTHLEVEGALLIILLVDVIVDIISD
jgi:hypothetical protein